MADKKYCMISIPIKHEKWKHEASGCKSYSPYPYFEFQFQVIIWSNSDQAYVQS